MRRTLAAVVLVAALFVATTPAAAYHGGRRVTAATEAPYSVLIDARTFFTHFVCSGSIVDPSHVVTAAHCATGDRGNRLRPRAFTVAAGITTRKRGLVKGAQLRDVTRVRIHPAYEHQLVGYADVAVLEVDPPFQTTATVAPIALVDPGATPGPGAIVRGYGFGLDGRDHQPDEHALDLTMRPFSRCLPGIAGVACARSAVGTGCPGDSGGPIVTTTAPLALAGVISGGSDDRCAKGETAWFADLATPAIADFVRGDDHPPAMPFADELATLRLTADPAAPIACTAAPWRDATSTTTQFVHAGVGDVVQDGPATTYAPQAGDVGHRIGCRSIARSPGGTAWMPAGAYVTVERRRLCLDAGNASEPRCRPWTPPKARSSI
jgi:hypothetical protein